LHYYFRSKQALADRVFRDAAATLFTALPKALRPEASLEELLRSVVHAYIDTMRRTPFLPGYLMAEAHHDPGRFAEVIAAVTGADPRGVAAQVVARIQAQIDARAAAGEMRAMRAEQLMISVMSLLAFPFVARGVLAGVYAMDDAAFERFLDARRDDLPRFLLNAVRP
jgi:AcrR family transcriptional regulator